MCGALCEALVIVRDLKHHLLGYFVLHMIGNTARFVGAFVRGHPHGPRISIVPRQMNAGVAIQYRAGCQSR